MNDKQQDPRTPDDHDPSGWIILGAVLIVVGFLLGARNLGLVPWQVREAWDFAVKARAGIGVILIGVLLIVWAQSGHRFSRPAPGTRLYRSRDDKWLAGVLGGLAKYFGLDVTLLRLLFLALVFLFDLGALALAYIVMAIIVPQEPKPAESVPAPGGWPAP